MVSIENHHKSRKTMNDLHFFLNIDINECSEGTDRCDQNCHNNVGSYTCTCNVGYRLNTNGYGCDGKGVCTLSIALINYIHLNKTN